MRHPNPMWILFYILVLSVISTGQNYAINGEITRPIYGTNLGGVRFAFTTHDTENTLIDLEPFRISLEDSTSFLSLDITFTINIFQKSFVYASFIKGNAKMDAEITFETNKLDTKSADIVMECEKDMMELTVIATNWINKTKIYDDALCSIIQDAPKDNLRKSEVSLEEDDREWVSVGVEFMERKTVTCDRLVPQTNAHWKTDDSNNHFDSELDGYKQDAEIWVVCDPDFFFGSRTSKVLKKMLTCDGTGKWMDHLDEPWKAKNEKCKHDITCSVPENMQPKGQIAYYKETVNLQCTGSFLQLYSKLNGESLGDQDTEVAATCGDDGKFSPDLHCGTKLNLLVNVTAGLDYATTTDKFILEATKEVKRPEEVYKEVKERLADELEGKSYEYEFFNTEQYRYTNPATLLAVSVLVIPPKDTIGKVEVIPGASRDFQAVPQKGIFDDHATIGALIEMKENTCMEMYDNKSRGVYTWKEEPKGNTQKIACTTSTNEALATCVCSDQDGVCMWEPDYTQCPYTSNITNKIDEINKSSDTVKQKAEELANVTENMTADEIEDDGYDIGATTIERIIAGKDNLSEEDKQEINDNVIKIIDKFAGAGETVAYKEAVATRKYLESLDNVLKTAQLDDGIRQINGNEYIKIAILKLPKEDVATLTLRHTSAGVNITNGAAQEAEADTEDPIVVTIPHEIVKTLDETNRFYFVVFKTATFFTTEELFTGRRELQSDVFSAGVAGRENIIDIHPPIQFEFRREAECEGEECKSSTCVYWDEGEDYKTRVIEEVTTVQNTKGKVKCSTDHLTSFAILMSSKPIPPVHEEILETITYIGCSLSIIGLIMSLIGLSVFRSIRQPVATKVHINMSAALLSALLIFTIGINQYSTVWLCYTTAVLVHYFLLCAIFWMGVEGFHLYVLIVRVFGTLSNKFLLKCAAFAWGLPGVIVAATAVWDTGNYNTVDLKFCWLHQLPMIVMFMVPTMLVILVNTYMFVRVVSEISKSQNRMRVDNMPSNCNKAIDLKQKMVKVRAAISIMVLLGLTWALGPLLLLDMVPAIQLPVMYLFTACNALQGFLFFFFHCAIKTDVKDRWKTYLGIESSIHSKLADHLSYEKSKSNNPHNHCKTSDFSKLPSLGDSASSLNKSLLSFKPKFNKVRPGSADSDLAIVEF